MEMGILFITALIPKPWDVATNISFLRNFIRLCQKRAVGSIYFVGN
jgi:hypothetical protein